jgi:hypothetical protein
MATLRTGRGIVFACALLAGAALALALGSQAAAASAPKPPAPKPPTVYTGGFTTVGTSSVTFKGSVNPHGLATVYAFQFGTTTGYGAQTALASAGNGTTEIKVSQTITGLPPGATYHYRLIATNGAGTTNGKDATFTKKIPLTFKLAGTPNPTVFGSPFTVSGVLSGTGAANAAVVLQANPFPYLGGFKTTTGPQLTSAAGAFSFPVANLTETIQLRVAVAGLSPIYSRAVVARVAVRVSLHLSSSGRSGYVRMYGTVAPAQPGGRVAFQLVRSGRRTYTVASAPLTRAGTGESRFSRIVRIRRGGLYRAYVPVASGKQVPGHSRPLLVR